MIQVDFNRVVDILTGKIADLEKQLAMARAGIEAMSARLTELEPKE